MKIKLAILDKDSSYLNHFINALNTSYQDSLEIHGFTKVETLEAALVTLQMNVLLADSSMELDISSLPKGCSFAYLVNDQGVTTISGQRAISKYQKTEVLYNYIMDLYAESDNALAVSGIETHLPLYIFTSASGGTGASSAAAGYAKNLASFGRSVLYLNLEKLGTPSVYFSGEGNFTMSDILFAIKSKRTNVALKLQSNVRKDPSGVYWYEAPENPLDLQELGQEDIVELYQALTFTGMFERLVVDMNFGVDNSSLTLMQLASAVVFVSDGSDVANKKFQLAYHTLALLEKQNSTGLLSKVTVLYNQFSNKTGQQIDQDGLRSIGGIPRIERATVEQVIAEIMKHEGFSAL